jgi:hypothetical protein
MTNTCVIARFVILILSFLRRYVFGIRRLINESDRKRIAIELSLASFH